MCPLTAAASAVTLGSESDPVNAWYWKANLDDAAFDVIARGYGTSGRHTDPRFPIACSAYHQDGYWDLVLSRTFSAARDRVAFNAGGETRMAFAVWDGGNRERSGRKSFSGDFVAFSIDA
jgi:DMSO reductase family type II enzyme heme b subunit